MLSLTKLNLIGVDYHTVFVLYLLLLNHTYHLSTIIVFLENILVSFDNKSNYLNYLETIQNFSINLLMMKGLASCDPSLCYFLV